MPVHARAIARISGNSMLRRWYLLENCINSVYYDTYPLTLYIQVQFIKVHCSPSTKNAIECTLKKERLLARCKRDLNVKKRKYHEDTERKKQLIKKRYHDKKRIHETV